ncbi:MAG: hypothetical protein GMKNLPBB_00146 [Myxococcota bacterium]|nr:hypothetical protein [Myxococcota bacterium]
MAQPPLVLFEEEYKHIAAVCERLNREANAQSVYIVDRNGQLVAAAGNVANVDTTSLASLTAGNIATTSGLAKLIGESDFNILFHEGEKINLHLSVVSGRVILVVIFDNRSSLGLVRLRVKKASEELSVMINKVHDRLASGKSASNVIEITDSDIDNLFSE